MSAGVEDIRPHVDPADLPLSTSHSGLVAHARRLHTIRQLPPAQIRHGSALESLAVALSLALDLRLHTPADALTWSWDWAVSDQLRVRCDNAWGRASAALCRDLADDKPRNDPPRHDRCPGVGPRGGACPRRGGRVLKVVTDPATGAHTWGPVCPAHETTVRLLAADDPAPPPNRGGALRRIFPEARGIEALWDWAEETLTKRREARRGQGAISGENLLGDPPGDPPRLRLVPDCGGDA